MKEYYLSIAMHYKEGTHALFHMDHGILRKEEIYHFQYDAAPKNGVLTWDIDALFQEILTGMKKCAELGKIPVSMGITGWGADYVLLDENGKRCADVFSGMDFRAADIGEEINRLIPETKIYSMTGLRKVFFNTLYQLMADKIRMPGRLENAARLLLVTDYFHYLLTGDMHVEYTNAATTQLLDPRTKNWHYGLIRALGIPEHLFGKIKMPGTVFPALLPEIERDVGFSCKVILPCVHDTASLFTAMPLQEEHPIFIRSDDYSFIGTNVPAAICTEKSRKYEFTNEAIYDGFAFFKFGIGIGVVKCAIQELAPGLTLQEASKLAEESRISSVVELSDPRFFQMENIAAQTANACRELGQKVPKTVGETVSVLFQSLAKSFANTIAEAEKLTGQNATCIHVLGTMQHAHYLNQLICEETCLPVTSGPRGARLTGNAIVQMLHSGVFLSLADARECIRRSFSIQDYHFKNKEIHTDDKMVRSYHTAEIVIRCAKLLSGARDFDFAINQVLQEISRAVRPDRVTVIGTDRRHTNLLYEWTAADVPSNIKIFQNLPYASIKPWESIVKKEGIVVQLNGDSLPGTGEIHEKIIRRNNLRNFVEVPLYDNEELIGYLGVENFLNEEAVNVQMLLETISFFISSVMVNHRLMAELKTLGNTDMLTGVMNRNAMNATVAGLKEKDIPAGVLYADVNGLKHVNDTLGHIEGDALIKRAAGVMLKVFDRQQVYRAGGDEFVVIKDNIEKSRFESLAEELKQAIAKESGFSMAVGFCWVKSACKLDDAVREADKAMYADKQAFYHRQRNNPTSQPRSTLPPASPDSTPHSQGL